MKGKAHPLVNVLLLIGIRPQKLIKMGYPYATVYRYYKQKEKLIAELEARLK